MFSVPRAGSMDGKLEDTITTHASILPDERIHFFQIVKDPTASSVKTERKAINLPLALRSTLVDFLVEDDGIEPTTPCLQSRCSPS